MIENLEYYAMKQLFEEGKITFVELCEYDRTKTIPKRLINMETKELKIEIPEGYEIDSSQSSFEKIVFKKKENKLPKTWEEYYNSENKMHAFYSGCEIIHFSKYGSSVKVPDKYASAFAALNKLIRLRDVYNDGWEADWNNEDYKYCVELKRSGIACICSIYSRSALSFKTLELCNEFISNFKDLIKQAAILL